MERTRKEISKDAILTTDTNYMYIHVLTLWGWKVETVSLAEQCWFVSPP